MKDEARVGWKAGVQVSSWEDFGEVSGAVVLGILEKVMLGSGKDFRVCWVDSGRSWRVEWRAVYCWMLVEFGG